MTGASPSLALIMPSEKMIGNEALDEGCVELLDVHLQRDDTDIERHDDNSIDCKCGDGYCGCGAKGEGIEYELADYLLLHDIDYLQSRGSLRSTGSSRSFDASVYDNFDDLFVSSGSEEHDMAIRDSWTEAEGQPQSGLRISASSREDTEDGSSGDNARVLKNLLIKCLVRNNHKQKKKSGAGAEEIIVEDRAPKDPSVSSGDSRRLPRDPSTSNASNESGAESRNENAAAAPDPTAMAAPRDPPGEGNPDQMPDPRLRTREGRMEYHRHRLRGTPWDAPSVASLGPPRPEVVRYGPSGASVASRRTWHPRPEVPRAVPSYVYDRASVPDQVQTGPNGFSNGYLSLGPTYSHYSAYDPIGAGSDARAHGLIGHSAERRQRYKEMLLQQQRGTTQGRDGGGLAAVVEGVPG